MRLLATLLLFLVVSTPAVAADAPRRMAHYTHQRWSEESDPPRPLFSITQSPDGFLWVGASRSVYRFDGATFEPIPVSDGGDGHGSPMVMMTTRGGEVWAYYAGSGRFAIYRRGVMNLVEAPDPGGMVTSLTEDREGAIWVGMGETGRGMLRYKAGRWTRFGAAEGLPIDQLLGTVVGGDGSIWASYINSLVRLPPGGDRFETVHSLRGSHGRIAADREGRVWMYDDQGVRPITGPQGAGAPPPLRYAYRPVEGEPRGRMTFDPEGKFWIATRTRGLRRIARPDPRGATSAASALSEVESFRTTEGLTSDATRPVFVDHEGDVWVLTEDGLDRFRPASIRVEPTLTDRAAYGDLLMQTRGGDVFIAQASTVYQVKPGDRPRPILTGQPEPEALCEAPDGAIWIINTDAIVVWKDGRASPGPRKLTTPSGYYGCAFDQAGALWAAGGEAGLLRLESGRWIARDAEAGRSLMLTQDTAGRLVTHHAPDLLRWVTPTTQVDQRIDYGEASRELRSIAPLPNGELLAAGTFGLLMTGPGRAPVTLDAERLAIRGVRGLVQSPEGATWLAGQTEIVRIPTPDLRRAFADPQFAPRRLTLSFADGLPSRVATDAWRSMVQGGDGRLWVATLAGTVWIDPARLDRRAPPKIAIGALQVGDQLHRDPADLRLPAGAGDIRIAYSLLSFADPKSVQFRYRLIGYDKAWVDPGQRREAFYTNLPPGRYRFEVTGANAHGPWNTEGASVEFEIPPLFWQSHWFAALVFLALVLVVWLLHRLRLAQASAALHQRLEERARERVRIARELHDTFLQSVQGLVLKFQAVADRLPQNQPARQGLDAALARADDILEEGRDTLHDLRDTAGSGDLCESMRDLVDRFSGEATPISLQTTGDPRPLAPIVAAEATRIVREAVTNAQRHALARIIELSLTYGVDDVQVSVRDDGSGLPPAVLAEGRKKDHFGLVGMRERAQRIGGDIAFSNRPQGGVEVLLRLPAKALVPTTGLQALIRAWRPVRTVDA